MKAKLKILRKTASQVSTKYGMKEKHAFQLEGSNALIAAAGPFWADCFANSITDTWREGDTQEMELVSREYQGKTYWNVVPPKPADILVETLKRIEEKIDRMLLEYGENPNDHSEDAPNVTDAGSTDDIPF